MRFINGIKWELSQTERIRVQAVPGHGESVNRQVDERGKCGQKRKNVFAERQ